MVFSEEVIQVEAIEVHFTHLKRCSELTYICRAPDKGSISFSRMPISSPYPMFDHLLEMSYQDDSNKWSNIGFGEEITQV